MRYDDDWDDLPRRVPRGVPAWAWVLGGTAAALALVGGVVVAVRPAAAPRETSNEARGLAAAPGPAQLVPGAKQKAPAAPPVGRPVERWERGSHDPSGITWEWPTMGRPWADERASAVDVNGHPVQFSVDAISAKGGADWYTKVHAAQVGESFEFSTVEAIDLFEGRPRLVGRDSNSLIWNIADPEWYYRIQVFNPNADTGGQRTKRFLASIKINRPPPPGTGPGEEIPFGWDRVTAGIGARGGMSALLPQGDPPEWVRRRSGPFVEHSDVSRSVPNPKTDDDIVVAMFNLPSEGVFPQPKWFRESKRLTVGGFPAQYSDLANGDFRVVAVRVLAVERMFSYVVVSGYNLDPNGPEVKRALESISFTLPAKHGLRPPPDPPTWVRRFAPGTSFSVEMPGRWRPLRNEAPDPRGGMWDTKAELPGRNKSTFRFSVAATTTPKDRPVDPRQKADEVMRRLNGVRNPESEPVTLTEVGGRVGVFQPRSSDGVVGDVYLELFEPHATFTIRASGDGTRAGNTEIKRFLDSISFTTKPPAAGKK